jgi:uncharacterized protein with GYD domain
MVRVFVGEVDVKGWADGGYEARGEGNQRASCARAEVEDSMGVEIIEERAEARDYGSVGVAEAPERLQCVGEEIAQKWWEGWMVVDLDEVVVTH